MQPEIGTSHIVERARRLLIVEDDAAIRQLLLRVAALYGFDATTAGDGDGGYEAIARDEHDVILLDLVLPQLSGIQILGRLRREMPHVLRRIIVMTAAPRSTIDRCEGLDDVWCVRRKPLDILDLAKEMTNCAMQESFQT